MKNSSGCWTCKVRRKKCDSSDEAECESCKILRIPCHRGVKPEWMDGGKRQAEMAERMKREVRAKSHQRLISRKTRGGSIAGVGEQASTTSPISPQEDLRRNPGIDTECPSNRLATCNGTNNSTASRPSSETILLAFYLDNVLPFLLPFYHPDLQQEGGRAWILELTNTSPVFRRVALCQSSYFFALTQGTTGVGWDAVLAQTKEVFGMLRHAIETMSRSSVQAHLHGAVRIFTSIMQMQRFEISLMSFENCRAHLDAALGLFYEILASGEGQPVTSSSKFLAACDALGSPSVLLDAQLPNLEQAAFRLFTALLLLDDIIASTILKEPPRLYGYHKSLLGQSDDSGNGLLRLENVVGCPNWVLLEMGKTVALNAWKHRCQQAGSLDVLELARHAAAIRDSLQTQISKLEATSSNQGTGSVFEIFHTTINGTQRRMVARVWAHAALVHLLVVASGWQPANPDIRRHVYQVIELLHQLSPPSSLRALVWPFYIAGCLADDAHKQQFRILAEAPQPRSVYGTVTKALKIIERVWKDQEGQHDSQHDLCAFLRSQEDLILLV